LEARSMSGRDLACVSWSDNPLAPLAQSRVVVPGTTIGSLLPAGWERRRVVCKYNGRYILRVGWACPVQAGDTVEFHELVEGRNALRTILQIVVVAAAIFAPGAAGFAANTWQAAAVGAAVSIGGSLLINALLPLELPQAQQQQSPGSVYNVAVSGNQARVDQAIPVIYGRHPVKPDYAGEPYFIYDENGDQIGHFLYCIGHGRFQIEQELIGRTLLGGFQDVTIHALLEPGELPTEVLATVVTSREVINLDLPEGRRVGGFSACAPNKRVRAIGLDFVCPRGQGIDITVQVTLREVDDHGNGLTGWSVLANETISGNTAKPTRVSKYYELPASIRAEIRVARTSLFDDDPGTPNEIQWAGLRGYLDAEAPLCPTASHYEFIIRASEQLSSLSSNQFCLVVQRLLRVWNPETGWTADGAEVATRNPFHALADAWTNPDYVAHPLADSRVDLATLHALSLTAANRQDRCDIIFDSFVSGWEAAGVIARTGRATPFRRNGVCTATRDQAQTVTRTAFDSRSILPGSFSAQYALPSDETPDGLIAEYFDYRSWDWVEIECPAPGYTVTDPDDPRYDALLASMSKPERKRYRGITGPKHCEREGLYDAAWPVYRRKSCSWSTELQGMLPAFGSEVAIAPAIPRIYAQSGDVAFWDADTLVMGLTEPVVFEDGETHYIRLIRDDGSLTAAIVVDPGPTAHDVVLAFAPDFTLVLDDGTRERPRYQFGTADVLNKLVRITDISHQGIGDDGSQSYALSATVDDVRVHQADNHLLPAPGEEQDLPVPGEGGGGGGGGGGGDDTVLIVDMRTNYAVEWDMGAGDNHLVTVGMRFNPDGTLSKRITDAGGGTGWPGGDSGWVDNPTGVSGSGNWQRFAPVEPTDAAKYEVRATIISQVFDPADQSLTGTLGSWQGLGVERSWVMAWDRGSASSALPAGRVVRLRLEVREITSGLVQDTATLQLAINLIDEGGG